MEEKSEIEHINLDAAMEKEIVCPFLERAKYKEPVNAVITGLVAGQFKKPNLLVKIDDVEYRSDLSKGNKNILIEKFGPVPKKWIGQVISLQSVFIEFDTRDGKHKEGYEIKIL